MTKEPRLVVYLPLPPQDVLLHPLLGQLGGLHGIGVLLQPGVFEALRAGQSSPEGVTRYAVNTQSDHLKF